jgi:hypothetical protein
MLAAHIYGSSWPPVVTTPHGDSASPAAFVEESQQVGDRATIAHAHDNATKYCVGGIRHRSLSEIVTDRDFGREAIAARVERGQLLTAITHGPTEVLQFQVGACTDFLFCDFSIDGNFPAGCGPADFGPICFDSGFWFLRPALAVGDSHSCLLQLHSYGTSLTSDAVANWSHSKTRVQTHPEKNHRLRH